ncbi:MAG: hypothetical protein M5U01_15405 [Ardenticatenaceae bacterium]|nr:hypothetical protein [Ardenticatenaceae bacterium]
MPAPLRSTQVNNFGSAALDLIEKVADPLLECGPVAREAMQDEDLLAEPPLGATPAGH